MTSHNDPHPVSRPLVMGDQAPAFHARSTMGERSLEEYRGRWLVLFSHPADFTPVCTSEFVAFSQAFPQFQALGCELLALSVDSLPSHIAWSHSIEHRFGVRIPFPMLEDPSMAIARAYGMLPSDARSSATVRTTFAIDPAGVVRAAMAYPMTVGRSVAEILRLVAALQRVDHDDALTPEGWHPGEPVLLPPPTTSEEAARDGGDRHSWFYRLETV